MNVILNVCRITDLEVRSVLINGGKVDDEDSSSSERASNNSEDLSNNTLRRHSPSSQAFTVEQQLLFAHICKNLNSSYYHRAVRLLMASLSIHNKHRKPTHPHHPQSLNPQHEISQAKEEALSRNADIAASLLSELCYWLGLVDDLLSCGIRAWNVCLSEWIMKEVVVGTVLYHWNRNVVGSVGGDSSKVALEACKADAEIRASIWFITQVFGMVGYAPLIKMLVATVLHERYPSSWCGGGANDDLGVRDLFMSIRESKAEANMSNFFVATPALNAMITGNKSNSTGRGATEEAPVESLGEEADAGAGGGTSRDSIPPSSSSAASVIDSNQDDEDTRADTNF